MTSVAGYMLLYSDDVYEGPSILPGTQMIPKVLYKTIEEAEAALEVWKKKLPKFLPVLYGEVYPYDRTTARDEIKKKGYAIYGWAIVDEDDEDPVRYGMHILEVRWS